MLQWLGVGYIFAIWEREKVQSRKLFKKRINPQEKMPNVVLGLQTKYIEYSIYNITDFMGGLQTH